RPFPRTCGSHVTPARLKFPYTSCPQQALCPRRPTELLRRLRGTKTLNSLLRTMCAGKHKVSDDQSSPCSTLDPGRVKLRKGVPGGESCSISAAVSKRACHRTRGHGDRRSTAFYVFCPPQRFDTAKTHCGPRTETSLSRSGSFLGSRAAE